MEQALVIAQGMLKMLILLGIGIVAAKRGILNEERTAAINDIVIKIILPFMVFSVSMNAYDPETFHNYLWAMLLALIGNIISITVATLLIPKRGNPRYDIERAAGMFPNVGFIGLPLVQMLFGAEGALYIGAYVGIYNFLQWSYGDMLLGGGFSKKTLGRIFKQPIVLASIFGIIFFMLDIPVPELVAMPIQNIANCCVALPMFIVGSRLARCNIKQLLTNWHAHYANLVKLIFVPLVFLFVLKLFPVSDVVKLSMLIACACPTATAVTMLSITYDKDSAYASGIVSLNTILCTVSIPLITLLYSLI